MDKETVFGALDYVIGPVLLAIAILILINV
jgi:hypothetical protein